MLSQETISKVTPAITMPGVFDVSFRPGKERDQIWLSVYGAKETVDVTSLLAVEFATSVVDYTDYIPDDSNKIFDHNLYLENLIIAISGWLPKKEAPQQEGADKENLHPDCTSVPCDLEGVAQV